eukprot:7032376-Alexandrium_andersonii.AAC.1
MLLSNACLSNLTGTLRTAAEARTQPSRAFHAAEPRCFGTAAASCGWADKRRMPASSGQSQGRSNGRRRA